MSNKATKITLVVVIVLFAIIAISIFKPEKPKVEEPPKIPTQQQEVDPDSDVVEINKSVSGNTVVKTKDGHQRIMIGD